jgi:hypothetical protein
MIRRVGAARLGLCAMVLLAAIGFVLWRDRGSSTAAGVSRPESHAQTTWVACNRNADTTKPSTFHPLSDAAAATLVTAQRETRPDNDRSYRLDGHTYSAPNYFVPSAGQVKQFLHARTSAGQSQVQFNPYYAAVDGRDGLTRPTTDDLIQWGAHKWGIPEDWLRAEYVHESYWNQYMLGDDTGVSAGAYRQYPSQSRDPHARSAYQSLGITQLRWTPDRSLHPGTEPLRWLSTAFNIDYQAATVRFYYDNPSGSRKAWNDPSYQPCEKWSSIGGWFSPYPWNNAGQRTYAGDVQQLVSSRAWTQSDFVGWSPPSLPPGITLR